MSRLAGLVTCIVARSGDRWEITWASDGKTPRDSSAPSLDQAVLDASAQVAALYAGHSQAAGAELQFAIYPWEGTPGDVILDIAKDGGELKATDIQGSDITFSAGSLDALVEAGGRYTPDPSKTMFRWILRVTDLGRR